MGNNQSCGFGVVNSTEHELTVGLSMAGTHYYENYVKPGEVFYRWPGAVWYTVYVWPTRLVGEMTDEKKGWEITESIVKVLSAAGGGPMRPATSAMRVAKGAAKNIGKAVQEEKPYAEMKGCYGGGEGTWLEAVGRGTKLSLKQRSFEYVKQRSDHGSGQWSFTRYSGAQYKTGLTN